MDSSQSNPRLALSMNMSRYRTTFAVISALAMLSPATSSFAQQQAVPATQQAPALSPSPTVPAQVAPVQPPTAPPPPPRAPARGRGPPARSRRAPPPAAPPPAEAPGFPADSGRSLKST